jgi:DNA-cytosine methyltransferase
MKILSVFDGCSGAQQALKMNGLTDYTYESSEIDKYAIKITQKNFPNTIQLGKIEEIKSCDHKGIHLLVGGSPCQDLTLAGNKKGLDGERSKLFFEFIRLKNEINPKYFLLENVASMTDENRDIMSKYMGVEPLLIDSALFTAQRRERYYWTNIPQNKILANCQDTLGSILEKDDVDYELSDTHHKAFLKSYNWKPADLNKKSKTLMATYYKQPPHQPYVPSTCSSSGYRRLTPLECERLQGMVDNYTEGVSDTQRYKMIGNGFTIPVIAHLLKNI